MIQPSMTSFREYFELCARYPVDQVRHVSDWKKQLGDIRHAYKQFEARIKAGGADWMEFEPYTVGDWAAIFTPIEQAVWGDIRASGMPLWPQLPVGRFFVDFGNPVARVAIECDGQDYHDAIRDSERDLELMKLGWTTYRIPGWRCNNVVEHPRDPSEMDDDDWEAYEREKDAKTTRGIFKQVAQHFPANIAARVSRM